MKKKLSATNEVREEPYTFTCFAVAEQKAVITNGEKNTVLSECELCSFILKNTEHQKQYSE